MNDLLFHGSYDLSDALRAQIEQMKREITDTSPACMNGASDEELIAHYVSSYSIETLTIYYDRAQAEHRETKVDVSHDRFRRLIPDGSGPVMVKGDEITICVPFTGDSKLFKFTPSTRCLNPPRGRVEKTDELGGYVLLSLALPSDTSDGEQFNQWISNQLNVLKQYDNWIRNDVSRFNTELKQQARAAIQSRRQQLEKQGTLLQKISIPLCSRSEAPSPISIPMPKRVVKPLPPTRKVEQEYGLSKNDYEYILKIIRHESRSFESTPATFIKFSEEELRDVVLAHLNGHFEGDAAGERFRAKGKTDICIEHDNRAAFVAECKFWNGQKAFNEAFDQLLGYLTWRDTHTALIVWNKNVKDFANLQSKLPRYIESHPKFVRSLEAGYQGEWRALLLSETDDSRNVIVHVFLVDLSPGNME